jgi:glycosyltransferase involved in cell wall biosynthesis
MPVTVIIPTLNEEGEVAAAVDSAFAAGAAEVIIADGGSVDRTTRFATGAGARVLLCQPMRAARTLADFVWPSRSRRASCAWPRV